MCRGVQLCLVRDYKRLEGSVCDKDRQGSRTAVVRASHSVAAAAAEWMLVGASLGRRHWRSLEAASPAPHRQDGTTLVDSGRAALGNDTRNSARREAQRQSSVHGADGCSRCPLMRNAGWIGVCSALWPCSRQRISRPLQGCVVCDCSTSAGLPVT